MRAPLRPLKPSARGSKAAGSIFSRPAFLIFQNPSRLKIDPAKFDPLALGFKGLKGARNPGLAYRLRIAMLANGVDIMGAPGGLVSAVHGAREVAHTLEAFRTAVRWLKAEGDV